MLAFLLQLLVAKTVRTAAVSLDGEWKFALLSESAIPGMYTQVSFFMLLLSSCTTFHIEEK